MTVREIMKTTAILLQMDSLLSSNYFTNGTTSTQEQATQVTALTTCFNLVNNIIATEYMPLLAEAACTVTDGRINYSDITTEHNIFNIKKVRSTDGDTLTFSCFPTYLKTQGKKVIVTYAYYPKTLIPTDEANTFGIQLSSRVYSYGMACEYCFMNGLYDEANMWDKRFKDALKGAIRRLAEVKLPSRSWS